MVALVVGLAAVLVPRMIDGPDPPATTTTSATKEWMPPTLDPPPLNAAQYGRIDVQPNDRQPGLGHEILYRGYSIGYAEAWVVVHSRIGAWSGNYSVGQVHPNPEGYWEIVRETFGTAGPGTTVEVSLIVPLDDKASDWLQDNYRNGNDPGWVRDDSTFARVRKRIIDKIQVTQTRK
jgi:hypothetical protein